MKKGFNCKKYIKLQKKEILNRVARFNNKLYLEVGGKLFDDMHASRVLPGFVPSVKTQMLAEMKKDLEVIFCISAKHITQNKVRGDYGITYAEDAMRLVRELRRIGILVSSIVVTMYDKNKRVNDFINKERAKGEKVYIHHMIDGYPDDVDTLVSERGYGKNPYIPTTKKIVVVAAPGPCSGKMATCLSQMYHEYKMGKKVGYAKYESFPIWNLPVDHPVNIAYEAATADLGDVNMIDHYHQKAYNKEAVNYNRDIESFPVLREIIYKITGEEIYKSPTDMGVNKIGFAITNDHVVKKAGIDEVYRRLDKAQKELEQGIEKESTVKRLEELVDKVKTIKP